MSGLAQAQDTKEPGRDRAQGTLSEIAEAINPKPKKVRKPKPAIRLRKRRAKKDEVRSKKFISEEQNSPYFRIQFPEELEQEYGSEIMKIEGAHKPVHGGRIPYDPQGDTPNDQLTYCSVYRVRISEETLQRVVAFGRTRRFEFDGDIALRAQSSSSEGKELERLSYAKSASELALPSFKFNIDRGTKKPFKFKEFQKAGILYNLKVRHGFVADEMGLGKTITGIGTIVCDKENVVKDGLKEPWLIITPSSLRINWYKEIRRWLPTKRFSVAMIRNRDVRVTPKGRPFKSTKLFLKSHDIYVMTYDKVHRYGTLLEDMKFRGVIFDESHYLKGRSTKRTIAYKAFIQKLDPEFCLLLTGTPLMNKPIDLISQLQVLNRLDTFGGFNHFLTRYCQLSTTDVSHVANVHKAGKADVEAHTTGVDADGTETVEFQIKKAVNANTEADQEVIRKLYENMVKLNKDLRSQCYVRREKEDVLAELPPKSRQTIPLEINNRRDYEAIEADVIGYLADQSVKDEKFLKSLKGLSKDAKAAKMAERRATTAYRKARAEELVRIEALKQCAAVGKLSSVKEWIEDFLESGKKLVVFAMHKIILNELEAMFPHAVSVRANMSPERRDDAVTRFQTDKKVNLILMGLKLAQGLTLHAASDTCTIEFGWTPAVHDQAEDRVHRIGQKKAVTAYYLVAAGTIEEKIGKLIEEKRRVVNAVADGDPLKGFDQGTVLGSLLTQLTGRMRL